MSRIVGGSLKLLGGADEGQRRGQEGNQHHGFVIHRGTGLAVCLCDQPPTPPPHSLLPQPPLNRRWPVCAMPSATCLPRKPQSYFFFFKDFISLILDRGEGREKERERNSSVWLPLTLPLLGTWPTTQAYALTGNQTRDPLVYRLVLNPLESHRPGQGPCF